MTRFVLWMLLASALGFIKFLALAHAMPVYDYGQYVTFIGIATFAGMLASFGINEKTTKDCPRRWVTGQRKLILADSVCNGRIFTLRFIFAGGVGVALSFIGLVPITPSIVIWITVLGLCIVLLALIGSLYRATGSQKALQNFTLWRYAVTLAIVLPAGSLLGWQGAIVAEIGSSIMAIFFAIWQLPRLYKNVPSALSEARASSAAESGHYQLYFANLALAPQSMLDRGWISIAIGPALAGSYGVIMLIPQAAQLLGNAVVQHVGPLVIKLVHLKQSSSNHQTTFAYNVALMAIFSAALTSATLAAKRLPYLNHFFAKFEISDISLVIAGVVACGQIFAMIEFHLIARDREHDVLVASLTSLFIFFGSFAAAAAAHASIEWFLASVGVARWSQVFLLVRAYLRYA
jgi:O-antigen/teichoic acid export membrane protein